MRTGPRQIGVWLLAWATVTGCGQSASSGSHGSTQDGSISDAAIPEDSSKPLDAQGISSGDSSGGSGRDGGGNSAEAGGASAAPMDAGPIVAPQPVSPNIVVDQFGYLPSSEKIAVIRAPQMGFDSKKSFSPGAQYALVDAHSSRKLLEAAPTVWNGGATDSSSGDKAWWLDFSSITTPSDYFVLDEAQSVRSPIFRIDSAVYRPVLVQTIRMFYYQRDGTAKPAQYAGADWTDGVAHPQDAACGLYTDGSAPHDLHGGWFDAGDQNRYTNWAAMDVVQLLRAYSENPGAFTDDSNIPESGNGVADLLDEIKWELDWIGRMQQQDGSVLSIAGHAGASPPSSDTSPCRYGPANTSAAFSSAAALAYGAIVFGKSSAATSTYPGYASSLATMAQKAWSWGNANPNVTFYNSMQGNHNVGAGEQELSAADLLVRKAEAAVFLFELTGDATYKSVADANVAKLTASFDPFHMEALDAALEYAKTSGATASVAQTITSGFKSNVEGSGYFGTMQANTDPYLAWLQTYTWGSNQVKAGQGNMFADVVSFGIDSSANSDATRYAERYVHYIHGTNPLGIVYLSNMGDYGAEKSVTRFFHSWFAHGSTWDAVGVSKYGPPPGYLTGGPNPGYTWDSCCPSSCSGCGSAQLSPPAGQPDQKSYLDFNDNWPLDSWQVTEPDLGYQAQYVRLLSKFVQ